MISSDLPPGLRESASATCQEVLVPLPEDWSFAALRRSETLWGPHGYHRYPAKFIPQLVRRLIERYSAPGDLVGDCFVGSATTGIEALRAHRHFWGSDINPIALLIGWAKCTPLEPDELATVWRKLDERLQRIARIGRCPLTAEERATILGIDIAHATAQERFTYWFPQRYQRALGQILDEIIPLPEDALRTFFLCAFSNILRRSSIWLSGSTRPQKDLIKVLADPVEEFRKQVRDMMKRNALYWADLRTNGQDPGSVAGRCQLVLDDARHLSLADGALALLVSSPPYATCYEYSELHQLTELWLTRYGVLPARADAGTFIGTKGVTARGRATQSNDGEETGSAAADAALSQLAALAASDLTERSQDMAREVRQLRYYFHDMQTAITECARAVGASRHMILIVGDSRKRGLTIPTSQAVCEMASRCGLTLERRIVREIPARVLVSTRDRTTGRFSSTANSDSEAYPEEDILIFRRDP